MGTTYRFIEEPDHLSEVLDWFRSLPTPPVEHPTIHGVILYFREQGPLVFDEKGATDPDRSPVVNVFLPHVRRGVLWTVGEVHFLPTPLRRMFPELHKISAQFSRWLNARECIFARTSASNPYDYYLEGSVRNFDVPIYAFESGSVAIRGERYFVAERDNEFVLEKVCRTLNLRGIACASA